MILIEKILIDEDILECEFLCDLSKCKGACCTFPGDKGAPVKDSEVQILHHCLDAASEYLSKRNLKYIEKHGIVEGEKGDYTTVCINNRDCVFVYFDNGIAYCAIERAYLDGKIDFRKPISCHLFPIRVGSFNRDYLYYSKIDECNPAIERGKKNKVHLTKCVKDALIRAYGTKWYNILSGYIESKNGR
jgi:hypothetical protein